MAEYPPRSCGPCPHLAHFAAKEEPKNKDWLSTNTIPKPDISYNEKSRVHDSPALATTGSSFQPDLKTDPVPGKEVKLTKIKKMDEEFMGGIPPCHMNNEPPICCLPGADPVQRGLIPKGFQICKEKREQDKLLKSYLKESDPAVTAQAMYAAVGRSHPSHPDPSTKVPVPSEHRPEPTDDSSLPCYLPQPQDSIAHVMEESMGPVGPWATGRVDWGPLSGLTGIRPIVDKYSIARYSEGEWRGHNKKTLDGTLLELHRANLIDWNGRQCLQQTFADADKNQEDNTKRLQQRELEIHRWKCEAERAIEAATEELYFMENDRHRLREAFNVLNLQKSIAGECLDRRTSRIDTDLVRDEVEDELIREVTLINEVRELLTRTLKDVDKQIMEDKTAKGRLEYDWSDKLVAHEIDSTNMALNTRSTILMFKPGAVRFSDEQSTPEFWEHFIRETVIAGEATRQRSATLRNTVNNILLNAARDLRSQADRAETALAKRIACNREMLNRLENELKTVLRRIAEIENLKDALKIGLRRLDIPVKKAQTRLDNRMKRPRVENCRDAVHFGLMEECKTLGEGVAAVTAQLNQARDSLAQLVKVRQDLEREILIKRKTLEIDCERTSRFRSFYPSASALTGR
ncbi:unnamed protein product [Psylliodes chrysocephalus]|uniref:Tektin n=1 Tax=Psylliodes chrysocephalus TaxID=3402493 RepID=A0A9P0D5S1_9CUCU|nr:unnamed protein product [Psylliodes chrysocephala]